MAQRRAQRRHGWTGPGRCVCTAVSDRTRSLKPEGAYKVLQQAGKLEALGRSVCHLEIGQPSGNAPQHVCDAALSAITSGDTKYVSPSGVDRLRHAVAHHVSSTRNADVSPSNVVIGPGCKPGLFNAANALVNTGSELVYPDPGFPTYKALADVTSATGVPVLLKADGSGPDMDALRCRLSENTALVIINSPSNPTSGVMPEEDVRELVRLAHEYDFVILSDEIYSQLVFNEAGKALSPLSLAPERTVMVDGASKAYRMTGWRLGWTIAPEHIARTMGLLAVHSFGCTSPFVQAAGIAALEGPQDDVYAMREEYMQKRDYVCDSLNAMDGISCVRGEGAFYAFPNCESLDAGNAEEVSSRILQEEGVALLPGTDFGEQGEGHVRISFVGSWESLEDGMERLSRFAQKQKQ